MSNQYMTTVRGSLELIFRNGRYGAFPVGTLLTNIGTFACRDKWLEGLAEGSYQGEFAIGEIALSGYMTKGPIREQRTFIKVIVNAYRLDNMTDEVQGSEYDNLDDPILDDDESVVVEVVTETPENPQPEPVIEISSSEPVNDPMVAFICEQLRSVGNDTEWSYGDAISIPADLGRAEQRKIRDYLLSNGYKMTDPLQRLWEVVEEVTYA